MVHCFLCDDNAEVTNFEDSTQLTAISAPLSYKGLKFCFGKEHYLLSGLFKA